MKFIKMKISTPLMKYGEVNLTDGYRYTRTMHEKIVINNYYHLLNILLNLE